MLLPKKDATRVSFSLSGSGETLEDAFVSCVGEGIDRLAQVECPTDVTAIANLAEVADRTWPAAIAAIEHDMALQGLPATTPLAWVSGKPLDTSSIGRSEGHDVLLPADWCLRRATGRQRLRPRTALSVGVAAGPTFDWAASRALLELIERDAASLWWTGGRRGKAVPLDHPAMAEIQRLVGTLRQHAHDRISWLLDLATDIGIPVIAALSCDMDGKHLAYGLAARLSLEDARARGNSRTLPDRARNPARTNQANGSRREQSFIDRSRPSRTRGYNPGGSMLRAIHSVIVRRNPREPWGRSFPPLRAR